MRSLSNRHNSVTHTDHSLPIIRNPPSIKSMNQTSKSGYFWTLNDRDYIHTTFDRQSNKRNETSHTQNNIDNSMRMTNTNRLHTITSKRSDHLYYEPIVRKLKSTYDNYKGKVENVAPVMKGILDSEFEGPASRHVDACIEGIGAQTKSSSGAGLGSNIRCIQALMDSSVSLIDAVMRLHNENCGLKEKIVNEKKVLIKATKASSDIEFDKIQKLIHDLQERIYELEEYERLYNSKQVKAADSNKDLEIRALADELSSYKNKHEVALMRFKNAIEEAMMKLNASDTHSKQLQQKIDEQSREVLKMKSELEVAMKSRERMREVTCMQLEEILGLKLK